MVRRFYLVLAMTAMMGQAQADTVDVAAWAAGLPTTFEVHGTKVEPTWQESVDIARDGDRFTVTGGAPAWARRATEVAQVSGDGALCIGETDCTPSAGASGFLASAGLVAAARRHQLAGHIAAIAFGARQIVCLPGEVVGIIAPVLDPCFDRESGAAVAQRHRLSEALDGATLDPASLTITVSHGAEPAPQIKDQY